LAQCRHARPVVEQFVDAVGGDGHRKGGDSPAYALDIGAVDARLVRLAARPERERRGRGQKGPARQVRRSRLQSLDQGGVARAEPVKERVISGPRGHERLLLLGVHGLRSARGDVGHGPAMDAAEVPDQIAQPPLGAGGDRRVEGVCAMVVASASPSRRTALMHSATVRLIG
jgi:hypothetical protein